MNINIKDVFKDDYISRQAGEKLRFLIVEAVRKKEMLILDFKNLIIASTSFFDEGIAKLVDEKISVDDFLKLIELKDLNENDRKVLIKVSDYRGFNLNQKAVHPWRLCPVGEHWVKEHLRVTKSGTRTVVDGHCRNSPSGKDIITADEIHEIANKFFKELKNRPQPNNLKFPSGNSYDDVIAGWCEFWNDVLAPEQKISPDFVKILIATESGFDPSPKVSKTHKAIGIMQIMPETIQYLSSSKKELKNHYVEIDEASAKDPVVNIAAGIRWLFRKYELTKFKLKRQPTWKEVLYEYKGITNDHSEKANKIKETLDNYFREMKL